MGHGRGTILAAVTVALVLGLGGCGLTLDVDPPDQGPTLDGGSQDGGARDAGETDAGETDAGAVDAGRPDAGWVDAGRADAGPACRSEADCDDGNPCTDDVCAAGECAHENNTAACDDGDFCNGPDKCSDGRCSIHPGDPCDGDLVCDPELGACVGCVADADCSATVGPWGSCSGFDGPCDRTGTQQRIVTGYSCVDGTCRESDLSEETQGCERPTAGEPCGSRTCSWDTCDYAGPCDEEATQTGYCATPVCGSDGHCTETSTETLTDTCVRNTDGRSCADGSFCNGEEQCSEGSCVAMPPCDTDRCDETADTCECTIPEDCAYVCELLSCPAVGCGCLTGGLCGCFG